jgi:Ala-tRNA(Pro) deacylase
MIPKSVTRYLDAAGAIYTARPHPTTYQAHELASALGVEEPQVAKSVVVEVDGDVWLAVLPATEQVALDKLADALHADDVRLLDEPEIAHHFPECELGAAPPFGALFGLPVAAEKSLIGPRSLVFNGGTHREAIEMTSREFAALERPRFTSFGEKH